MRGFAGLWSSSCCLLDDKLLDVLPAIPLVGFGETAHAGNVLTLKSENWLWNHPQIHTCER